MRDLTKRLGIGLAIGLGAGLLIAFGTNIKGFVLTTLLDGYEFRSYDSRMRARVSGAAEGSIDSIVIVDIDQNSVMPIADGGLGNFKDWPQAHHGQLIDVLASGKSRAILFDIIFDKENRASYDVVRELSRSNPPGEGALADKTEQFLLDRDPLRFVRSTAAAGNVYHALVFEAADTLSFLYPMDSEPEGFSRPDHLLAVPRHVAERLPQAERMGNTYVELLASARRTGSANFPQDEDGIVRRAPTAIHFSGPGHVYPTLAIGAAMDLLGIPPDGLHYDFERGRLTLTDTTGRAVRAIPIDDQGRMYVNFYGTFKTFTYLPYVYCVDPEMLDPAYWKDRIAIVGSSLPGLMDMRSTPVQESFSGVEIHANVLHSILKGEFVRPASRAINLTAIVLLAAALGLIVSIPSKPLYTLPVPLLAIGGWIIWAYADCFRSLVMWEIVRPSVGMASAYLGIFLYNFLVVEKDKRFLKNTFGTYVSPELIDQMYKNKQEPKLGGEEGLHTAFFTDIQSFSGFSEKLTPTALVELLNEYLTEMTNILLANKGTLDKYIGDAIVAFFGAPAPVERHAYYGCLTAVRMQARLGELRAKWQGEGGRWPEIVHHMQNRIGINSGAMVTGNMGSAMRMNYTMMGDTVNLAARLEASAKQYGVYIQVAEPTKQLCGDSFVWRELDFVRVMGKSEPARVYELLCEAGQETPESTRSLAAYSEALQLYKDQNWDLAIEAFLASDALENMFPGRKTNPSRIYIPRCEHWKVHPPGDNWDGAWALTSK